MKKSLTFVILFCVTTVDAQGPPNESDSVEYAEAYALVFDDNARARKAERLLLKDGKRQIQDLPERELILLCRVYNELFDSEKELAAAKVLWEKSPDLEVATYLMGSSLRNNLRNSTTPESIIKFVDDSLSESKGSKRGLLLLRAQALSLKKDGISDEEKKAQIFALLLDASKEKPPRMESSIDNMSIEELVVWDHCFVNLFSTSEREQLRLAIKRGHK